MHAEHFDMILIFIGGVAALSQIPTMAPNQAIFIGGVLLALFGVLRIADRGA